MTETPHRAHLKTKVTFYLTQEELLHLDATVLEVKRRTGKRVDRSRYIREALISASLTHIAHRIGRA